MKHRTPPLSSLLLLSCITTVLCFAPRAQSQAPAQLQFPGADGKEHTPLVVPAEKKAAVLCFVSPYCPTSNTFVPELNRIAADYGDKFAFYFVHADPDVKLTDVLQHTEMNEIKATVILDKEQKLARLTQAKITPEVAVLAPDGKTTLYQGRVNDLYLGPTKRQRQATTKDLRDALDAIQEGKPVANARTEAMGCKISGMK
jgi:thiol-disulfide isomerase/thioredoxin